MIVMHGLFDLLDDAEESQFDRAFESFSRHLHKQGLILSWRFMQHQAHDGYNSGAPATKYYVAIDFSDMNKAQECWDVIEEKNEPLNGLHIEVFTRISNYRFFLTSLVADS